MSILVRLAIPTSAGKPPKVPVATLALLALTTLLGAECNPKPTASSPGQFEQNMDRPGGDYRDFDLKRADPELCRAACFDEPRCQAFTYADAGDWAGPKPHCWLKSSKPTPRPKRGHISGVRAGQAVDPGAPFAAYCGKAVRLQSWKGDYLHRPDSAQGATSWPEGKGNTWTWDCLPGSQVRLRSWKGDYLHRPDGAPSVTTWGTGRGNEWWAEAVDGKVQLKSWKGDYLHRPDGAPRVTTWGTGVGNRWTLSLAPDQASAQASNAVDPAQLCDKQVELQSWKGDYLHRPDSPQGVTVWGTGEGNRWIWRCVGGDRIKLESWKGDFLHRPDAAQGVTSWKTGIGNQWIAQFAGDRVALRSWKGDFLHRPDGPPSVTTWSTGIGNEWRIKVVAEGSAHRPTPAPAVDARKFCGQTVQLKSWKGDFLHRPDGRPEVTSWAEGAGNLWTWHCLSDGRVRLESWKNDYLQRPQAAGVAVVAAASDRTAWTVEAAGRRLKLKSWSADYLHRPDGGPAITTWGTGKGNEWTVTIVVDPPPVPLDQEVVAKLVDWATEEFLRSEQPACWRTEGRGLGYPWEFGDTLFSLSDARTRCQRDHGRCEKNGLIIYPVCPPGYTARGCCLCEKNQCDGAHPVECALMCAQTDATCATATIEIVIAVGDIVLNIAGAALSGGTANAALKSAKAGAKAGTAAGKAAAKAGLKQAIKQVSKRFAGKLRQRMGARVIRQVATRGRSEATKKLAADYAEEVIQKTAERLSLQAIAEDSPELMDIAEILDPTGVVALIGTFDKSLCSPAEMPSL